MDLGFLRLREPSLLPWRDIGCVGQCARARAPAKSGFEPLACVVGAKRLQRDRHLKASKAVERKTRMAAVNCAGGQVLHRTSRERSRQQVVKKVPRGLRLRGTASLQFLASVIGSIPRVGGVRARHACELCARCAQTGMPSWAIARLRKRHVALSQRDWVAHGDTVDEATRAQVGRLKRPLQLSVREIVCGKKGSALVAAWP